jgi:prevent-host-death family protein
VEVAVSPIRVGIRELKEQLSRYVERVKSGSTVVITERGEPVGWIVPIAPSLEGRLRRLAEADLVAWSGRRLRSRRPTVRAGGSKAVADLLLEDRG